MTPGPTQVALSLNTPTGPLSSSVPCRGLFNLDLDPNGALGIWYGGVTSPTFGEGRMRFLFPPSVPPVQAESSGTATIYAQGYAPASIRFWVGQTEGGTVELEPSTGPFPVAPSRDQVCGIKITAQGLTVTISSGPYAGTYPWFEPGLQCLPDLVSRQEVYAAKKAAGDEHLILEFSTNSGSIYNEGGQPFQAFITPSFEQNPAQFLALVEEVIQAGFVPIVVYDGDNGDNPVDGYPNALRQLPILDALMQTSGHGDLRPYILFARFWDGVFYGSSPENIQNFGTQFRALNPNGYLAIEHQPGRIPVGGGPGDYAPGGKMDGYDVVCSEFDNGLPRNDDPTGNNPGCSMWQVVGRMVQPYIRPAEQPPTTDSYPPPFYFVASPRGPRYYCAFEFDIYPWVRSAVSAAQVQADRAYLRAMNVGYTG